MKGQIQTEIYRIRGGEITKHKSKYQLHVKNVLDNIDDQTDRFNFFYTEIFDSKQNHTDLMMDLQKSLPDQKALTNLQGVNSKAKDADLKFRELCSTTFEKMGNLATAELENLQITNLKMIESCTLIENGGNYSKEEVDWYREQIKEIDAKIEEHKSKRSDVLKEITELCGLRQKEAIEKFNAAYATAVDELTARDATGKIFGQPKREGQKIVRNEFAICQKVEMHLKDQITSFKKDIEDAYVGSLSFRQKFMSFRSCCFFYGRYLQAFIDDSPLDEHQRVGYNESLFRVLLEDGEDDSDDSRREEELKPLQRLYYRGADIRYAQKIKEMDAAVREHTAKLYVGQYSKFLGADKLTDNIRLFLANLKTEMDSFRIESIRQLRLITEEFVQLIPDLNRLLIDSIFKQSKGRIE